jgi:glutathione S-transferase
MRTVPRVLRIAFSTNVERVALAFAHKGLPVEWVDVDPADRAEVRAVSGQDLVPVLQGDDGEVIADSMAILRWLEERAPEPALWPADRALRAEADVFADWFNRVWKVAPNAIADGVGDAEALGAELRGSLDRFEALLTGRDFLLGGSFAIADVLAFPFLKYAVALDPADPDEFHHVLARHLALEGGYPGLEAWIRRVRGLPRA